MLPKGIFRQTTSRRRGRPREPGAEIRVTVRIRESRHGDVFARLQAIAPGKRSDYVRRVLEGAPVEVHEHAESAALAADLDSMFSNDDW